MTIIRVLILSCMLGTITPQLLFAQETFRSGSDGSYGAINVTRDTVTLETPPDGIFHATTISVLAGATLTFTRNALNTPVYLLATGNITIAGTVHVNGGNGTDVIGGAGGPGGFGGGRAGLAELRPGAGDGPGAGLGGTDNIFACDSRAPDSPGAAAYGTVSSAPSTNDGRTYGSPLLVPLVGGSGGGGALTGGGGGGGGALLLASDTGVHITGSVRAEGGSGLNNGASGFCNQGSGGGVRILAPVVSGTGRVSVSGGFSGGGSETAGAGRVRLDVIDTSQLALNFSPDASVVSTGGFLAVFPPTVPRLDIINVAGQAIPVGTGGPVHVLLPFDAPGNQTVVVQASHFGGIVPIEVVLTPDTGTPVVYQASIDMSTGNPAQVSVPVDVPGNVRIRVATWTRFP